MAPIHGFPWHNRKSGMPESRPTDIYIFQKKVKLFQLLKSMKHKNRKVHKYVKTTDIKNSYLHSESRYNKNISSE